MTDTGDKASKALARMLRAIDPAPLRARHYVEPLLQTRLGDGAWRHSDNLHDLTRRARRDVATLLRAQAIAARLARDADRRRRGFTSALRNPALIERRPFVAIMAEAWVFLFGQRPSLNPNPERNPFLRFVDAAWTDWKGADAKTESFVEALRDVHPTLTDYRVAALVRDCPDWGRITDPLPDFLWDS
jgi:hypothetical protein